MLASTLNVTRAAQLGVGEELGPSPGPIYLPKKVGGVGAQVLSNVATEPRTLIGTAPRFPPSHHADVGPGPGAYALSPGGKTPSWTLRGREKFGSQMSTTNAGNPGPGTHTRLETSQTRKKNPPAYSLRGRRGEHGLGDPTPAPGHTQRVAASIAAQPLSTKPNVPAMKFGTGGRPELLKPTTGEVGPADYPKAGDVSMIAGYRKPPAFSLSFRHPPLKPATADVEFKALPRGLGKQVVSHSRTSPAFSMAGRVKFAGFHN